MNIQTSQSSIVEALLRELPEGHTFTVKNLLEMDPRLRQFATAAYLTSQLKKGRLEVISKHGKTYDWRLPREFFEIPHKVRKLAGPGGKGGHPGKKYQNAPQLETRKQPKVAAADKSAAYRLFDLAVEVERGNVTPATIADLLDVIAGLLRHV